jgi:hypothetical protein
MYTMSSELIFFRPDIDTLYMSTSRDDNTLSWDNQPLYKVKTKTRAKQIGFLALCLESILPPRRRNQSGIAFLDLVFEELESITFIPSRGFNACNANYWLQYVIPEIDSLREREVSRRGWATWRGEPKQCPGELMLGSIRGAVLRHIDTETIREKGYRWWRSVEEANDHTEVGWSEREVCEFQMVRNEILKKTPRAQGCKMSKY